jgi:hypothetical protein
VAEFWPTREIASRKIPVLASPGGLLGKMMVASNPPWYFALELVDGELFHKAADDGV